MDDVDGCFGQWTVPKAEIRVLCTVIVRTDSHSLMGTYITGVTRDLESQLPLLLHILSFV